MPSYAKVRADYVPSEAWLLDRNGKVIGERRMNPHIRRLQWVTLDDISQATQNILLASEDRRFYWHSGIDWLALAGAAWQNLWHRRGGHPRGASTLTMQLAGFLDPALQPKRGRHRSWAQKWRQMAEAHALEQTWSKHEILEAYLNLTPFRGEFTGIHAAAMGLFDKQPSALTRPESLLLVALLKGTEASPRVAARRACVIVHAMHDANNPSCAELREFALSTLAVPPQAIRDSDLAPQLARRLLTHAGQRLKTTLSVELQRFATQSLASHLASLKGREVKDGAVVVLDNATGDVLAYVGSNRGTSDSPDVDGVMALRQPGSSLKPFLYGMAINRKLLTAASILDDSPVELATPNGLYIPQDYDKDFKGPVSVRTALASSLNVPAVRALGIVGVESFVQKLRQAGLKTLTEDGDFYGFGLALGAPDVRLIQLTNAYRALANGGMWHSYRFTTSDPKAKPRRILSPQAAFIIASILSDTNARATTFGFDSPLETRPWTAVKTGTSKDMRDNWCIGFSDRYTVGVWVGNFGGQPMRDVSGITGAAPVWRDIMEYLHKGLRALPRKVPPGLVHMKISYVPPVEAPRMEWFIKGTGEHVIRLAAYEDSTRKYLPRILYPTDGTIIAVDPDIPPAHQRVQFSARGSATLKWVLDGKTVGHGRTAWWRPRAGHHILVLADHAGKLLQKIKFEVRGRPERPGG